MCLARDRALTPILRISVHAHAHSSFSHTSKHLFCKTIRKLRHAHAAAAGRGRRPHHSTACCSAARVEKLKFKFEKIFAKVCSVHQQQEDVCTKSEPRGYASSSSSSSGWCLCNRLPIFL